MFTRPLALKLLAPTVLVSLALVSACIFGAIALNRLHVNLSKELTENVESTRAAERLGTTTWKLLELLRGDHGSSEELLEQVARLNEKAREHLAEAEHLANLEKEKVLVPEIAAGLDEYLQQWEERTKIPTTDLASYDRRLADVLDQRVLHPCYELRNYNLDQIVLSNYHNQQIVNTLNWALLAVGLGAPVSGLLLGYAVARQLHHSIYQLSVGIRDAAGRLNRELGSVTLNEEGDLPDLHRQMQGVIAEIERVIEQLQQREREVLRAEQLSAVGQVAAGVAHELRNPLTSVKMLVQTGLEGTPPSGLPAEDLGVIEHEIRRMDQCIQMLLDFARPPHAERRRTDLLDVLRRAVVLMEGRVRRQKVILVTNLPDVPIYALIDPDQIHQVVVNLLLNALDALPRGGTVQLSAGWGPGPKDTLDGRKATGPEKGSGPFSGLTFSRSESLPGRSEKGPDPFSGPYVEVQIRDSGSGIAPRIRERLFQPFVSSKETGVGLGLSICKRLIEDHGGIILGDNDPEGGAVFLFRLPVEIQQSGARVR